MPSDMNVVVLIGRLVRGSELRYPQNGGTPSLRFSIAVNRNRRGADGNWTEEANFFDCVYFAKNAEAMSQYLEKGRQVAIQGELRQNRWDSDGQQRSRVEIFVNNLTLLSQPQGGGSAPRMQQSQSSYSQPAYQQQAPAMPAMPDMAGPEEFQDDNIPF